MNKLTININSAYLSVKNMDRAVGFYELLFDQQVDVYDKVLSKFFVGDFRLCLFNPKAVGESVKYGDNCLLSFEVNDIHLFLNRLKMIKATIVYPLKKIGTNWVLEFCDTEGNDIEVYCATN